jgi:hypothetical protein
MPSGLDLVMPDYDFSNAYDEFLPPDTTNLTYWGFMGGSLAESVRNWAPGEADSTPIGAPVVESTHIQCNGSLNYLLTDADETSSMTMIMVVRNADTLADAAHRPVFFSNAQSPAVVDGGRTTFGVAVMMNTATTLNGYSGRWNGSANSGGVSITDTLANFAYVEYRVSETKRILRDRTNSLIVNTDSTIARDPGTGKFRIGSAITADSGLSDIAMLAAWNRYLSDSEVDEMYALMQQIMDLPRWNITI